MTDSFPLDIAQLKPIPFATPAERMLAAMVALWEMYPTLPWGILGGSGAE